MRRTVEKLVHGRVARWFRRRGWTGLTLPGPFRTVIRFWLLDYEADTLPEWRAHELRHAQQAADRGWIRWWLAYLWGLRRGYKRDPLEVDARRSAGQEE